MHRVHQHRKKRQLVKVFYFACSVVVVGSNVCGIVGQVLDVELELLACFIAVYPIGNCEVDEENIIASA